jgi:hypothetical protein
MLEFLRPIVVYDTIIYIFLGAIALIFLRIIWLARKDRIRSIFTLEREKTRERMTRAFIGLMVVLGLMLGVYYLSLVAPPILPPPANTPTPTPIVDLPPTSTPPLLLPTPTPTLTPPPPPTIVLEDTPTPAPNRSSGRPPTCPHPGARISQPGDGASVTGVVQISGAATIDNFDYYKFEFRVPGGEWNFIQRYNNAVLDGVLGSWNSDTVLPGEYEFRLVVVDTVGNYPEPCVIRLNVE